MCSATATFALGADLMSLIGEVAARLLRRCPRAAAAGIDAGFVAWLAQLEAIALGCMEPVPEMRLSPDSLARQMWQL